MSYNFWADRPQEIWLTASHVSRINQQIHVPEKPQFPHRVVCARLRP